MRGNFGLKLQNSPKLPHIHARLYCNANEKKTNREKGYLNPLGIRRFAISISISHLNLNASLACKYFTQRTLTPRDLNWVQH